MQKVPLTNSQVFAIHIRKKHDAAQKILRVAFTAKRVNSIALEQPIQLGYSRV